MLKRFLVVIDLDEREYQTVARAAAGQLEWEERNRQGAQWTMSAELVALLRRAIRDERNSQQLRDSLARELGAGQARLAAQIGLGDDAPAAPDWLAELLRDELGR